MKKLLFIGLIFLCNISLNGQCKDESGATLKINEFSNGDLKSTAEFIELIVVASEFNEYATYDFQGWIIDDNNEPRANVGNEPGHIRLGDCFNNLEAGTIILIYNDEEPHPGIQNSSVFPSLIVPFSDPCIIKMEGCPNHEIDNYDCAEQVDEIYDHSTFTLRSLKWKELIPAQNYADLIQVRNLEKVLIDKIEWGLPEYSLENSKAGQAFVLNRDEDYDWKSFTQATPGRENNIINKAYLNEIKNSGTNYEFLSIATEIDENDFTLSVSGGTPPYSVSIGNFYSNQVNNPQTINFQNLECGEYDYFIEDSNKCEESGSFNIVGSTIEQINIVQGECITLSCKNCPVFDQSYATYVDCVKWEPEGIAENSLSTKLEVCPQESSRYSVTLYGREGDELSKCTFYVDVFNDGDNDGIPDNIDNCPTTSNENQEDSDNDGIGDVCDSQEIDSDGDGYSDDFDNCPLISNPKQEDSDNDGIGDVCDNVNNDYDFDGVPDDIDNCPTIANSAQIDSDGDGKGDSCDSSNEEICDNGIDDDGDGLIDCADPDCWSNVEPETLTVDVCPGKCVTLNYYIDNLCAGDDIDVTYQWMPTEFFENPTNKVQSICGASETNVYLLIKNGEGATIKRVDYEINYGNIQPLSIIGSNQKCQDEDIELIASAGYDYYEWRIDDRIIGSSAILTGDYKGEITLYGFLNNGCVYTTTTIVSESIDEIGILSNDGSICNGTTILSVNSDQLVSYSWSYENEIIGTSNSINIGQEGYFKFEGVTIDGCTVIAEKYVEGEISKPKITPSMPTVCGTEGTEINLSGNYDEVRWLNSNNLLIGTDASININTPGSYTVEVFLNGCIASSEFEVLDSENPEDLYAYFTNNGFYVLEDVEITEEEPQIRTSVVPRFTINGEILSFKNLKIENSVISVYNGLMDFYSSYDGILPSRNPYVLITDNSSFCNSSAVDPLKSFGDKFMTESDHSTWVHLWEDPNNALASKVFIKSKTDDSGTTLPGDDNHSAYINSTIDYIRQVPNTDRFTTKGEQIYYMLNVLNTWAEVSNGYKDFDLEIGTFNSPCLISSSSDSYYLSPSGVPVKLPENFNPVFNSRKKYKDIFIEGHLTGFLTTESGFSQRYRGVLNNSDYSFLGYRSELNGEAYCLSYPINYNPFLSVILAEKSECSLIFKEYHITSPFKDCKGIGNGSPINDIHLASTSIITESYTQNEISFCIGDLSVEDIDFGGYDYVFLEELSGVLFKIRKGDSDFYFCRYIDKDHPEEETYLIWNYVLCSWQHYSPKEDEKIEFLVAVLYASFDVFKSKALYETLSAIPGYGAVFDLALTPWYLYEGEYTDATLSVIGLGFDAVEVISVTRQGRKFLLSIKVPSTSPVKAGEVISLVNIGARNIDKLKTSQETVSKLSFKLLEVIGNEFNKVQMIGAVMFKHFLSNRKLFTTIVENQEKIRAWYVFYRIGKNTKANNSLILNPKAINALYAVISNPSLKKLIPDKTLEELEDLIGYIKTATKDYDEVVYEIDDLLRLLPDNTKNLIDFLGSKGFGKKGNSFNSWRHSEVTLQGLLINNNILKNADEVSFEKRIESALNGNSEIDVQIVINNRVINIETKAGIEFFNSLTTKSNFVTQTANGIEKSSSLTDFKVFLNEDLIKKMDDPIEKSAYKTKVVNAWEGIIEANLEIQDKFIEFIIDKKPDFDFELNTISDYLMDNDDWFDVIFIEKNITP